MCTPHVKNLSRHNAAMPWPGGDATWPDNLAQLAGQHGRLHKHALGQNNYTKEAGRMKHGEKCWRKPMTMALCASMAAGMFCVPAMADDSTDVAVEFSKPITITFWEPMDNETYDQNIQDVVDAFNDSVGKDLGITVEMQVQSGGIESLETNLVAAIKAGSGVPNVIATEPSYVPDYLDAQAIVDLTPYMSCKDYPLSMDDYYDFCKDMGNSYPAEGYYTLPALVFGETLYYNVDFFKENDLTVPTTWDEVVDTCKKITAITGKPCFGWDKPLSMFTTLSTEAGAGYTDKDGNILFGGDNLQKAIDAVQWYKDQIDAGLFRTAGSDYYFSGPFGRNEVQLYIGSGAESQWIKYKFPEGEEFEFSCAPTPQGKEGWTGSNADYSDSYVLAMMDMNNDMEARYASWIFMQYFEQPESLMKYTTSGAFLPYLKSVANSDEWKAQASPAQLAGTEQMDYFFHYYGFEGSSALRSDASLAMQNILDNGADVTETITNLAATYGG